MDMWNDGIPDSSERGRESHELISEEQEKAYIGYAIKLRGVIDRFDVIISELECKRTGLESEKKQKLDERESALCFLLLGIAFWIVLALLAVFEGNMVTMFGVLMLAIPLFFYTIWIIVKYIKAIRAYGIFTEKKQYAKIIKERRIKTYYYWTDYYTRCIIILEKRKKLYEKLLKQLDERSVLTEKDLYLLENLSGSIFNITELGFIVSDM